MRHHDDREPLVDVQPLKELEHRLAGLAVEVARGLVGHQHDRACDERPRDRDALLLPAGELARAMSQPIAEPHLLERVHRPLAPLLRARALIQQRHRDVVLDRQLRQQVERLKDEPDLASAEAAERFVVEAVGPLAVEAVDAAGRSIEAAQDVHQRAQA